MTQQAESTIDASVLCYADQLNLGVKKIGLTPSDFQQVKLLNYLAIFIKWNKAYNLSAIRDPQEMVVKHLLDSVSIVPAMESFLVPGARFIDVGTGGGLPGIPLAIMFPETQFTLLDSNGKKTRFLFQVKTALALNNVTVETARVEKFAEGMNEVDKFDGVLSRAFASLLDMVTACEPLLKSEAYFWAMKGIYPQDELSQLPKHYKVMDSFELNVPGGEGERHLLQIAP